MVRVIVDQKSDNQAINTEWPTTRLPMENQPRPPGYRYRYPTEECRSRTPQGRNLMPRTFLFSTSLLAFVLVTSIAFGLTVGFGQRDIADAGPGCVGGWASGHGNTAYFCGDTKRLNACLASLADELLDDSVVKVVLHAGAKTVDNPEELPITDTTEPTTNQLPIDWSVLRHCPTRDILSGTCKCNRRSITVDVWIARRISLDLLEIPATFRVESGREIEQFLDSHRITTASNTGG